MALANQTNSLLTGAAERLRASLEEAGIRVPLGECASALKTHGNDPDRAGSWLVDTQRSSPPLPLGRTLRLPQTAGDVLVQASTGGGWSHLKVWWHASFAQLGAVEGSPLSAAHALLCFSLPLKLLLDHLAAAAAEDAEAEGTDTVHAVGSFDLYVHKVSDATSSHTSNRACTSAGNLGAAHAHVLVGRAMLHTPPFFASLRDASGDPQLSMSLSDGLGGAELVLDLHVCVADEPLRFPSAAPRPAYKVVAASGAAPRFALAVYRRNPAAQRAAPAELAGLLRRGLEACESASRERRVDGGSASAAASAAAAPPPPARVAAAAAAALPQPVCAPAPQSGAGAGVARVAAAAPRAHGRDFVPPRRQPGAAVGRPHGGGSLGRGSAAAPRGGAAGGRPAAFKAPRWR